MFASLLGRIGTRDAGSGRFTPRLEALCGRAVPSFSFGESLGGTQAVDFVAARIGEEIPSATAGEVDLCAGSKGGINSGGEFIAPPGDLNLCGHEREDGGQGE